MNVSPHPHTHTHGSNVTNSCQSHSVLTICSMHRPDKRTQRNNMGKQGKGLTLRKQTHTDTHIHPYLISIVIEWTFPRKDGIRPRDSAFWYIVNAYNFERHHRHFKGRLTDLICCMPVTCWRTFSSSFSMRPAQCIILKERENV